MYCFTPKIKGCQKSDGSSRKNAGTNIFCKIFQEKMPKSMIFEKVLEKVPELALHF